MTAVGVRLSLKVFVIPAHAGILDTRIVEFLYSSDPETSSEPALSVAEGMTAAGV